MIWKQQILLSIPAFIAFIPILVSSTGNGAPASTSTRFCKVELALFGVPFVRPPYLGMDYLLTIKASCLGSSACTVMPLALAKARIANVTAAD